MQQTEKDEINLVELFQYVGRLFSEIKRKVMYGIGIVVSRIYLFLFILALGLGIGYALYATAKPYYTSSMTLMLANIRNDFIEDQLNKLSTIIGEGNYVVVADRLDIAESTAKQIKEMKFSNLDQDRIAEDSVLTGSPFRIELSLYDSRLFDSLEPALTSYLENNRYFSKQKLIKQRQVERMINKLQNEITSIDSIKTTVGAPRGPVNGFVYGEPLDPTGLYRESIALYKEQVELEADLANLDNVEIVTGFVPKIIPSGPSLKKHLLISFLISFALGIVVTLSLGRRNISRR